MASGESSPHWILRRNKKECYAVLQGLENAWDVLQNAKLAHPDLQLRFKITSQVRLWWRTQVPETSTAAVLIGESVDVPAEVRSAVEQAIARVVAEASAAKKERLERADRISALTHLPREGGCALGAIEPVPSLDVPLCEVAAGTLPRPCTALATAAPIRKPPHPTVYQMNMPEAVRARLPEAGKHSFLSFAFAEYASSRCSDDWVKWEAPSPTLDGHVALALESPHALLRFRERLGEDRRVELLRCLRSADAYRAVARTARVSLAVNGARLEFSKETGRLLSVNRSHLGPCTAIPIPDALARLLRKGVTLAATGVSPGFGDEYGPPLDASVAAATLSLLDSGGPILWRTTDTLVAVTTTASLVLSGGDPAEMALITLLPSQEFSAWKKLNGARLKSRF